MPTIVSTSTTPLTWTELLIQSARASKSRMLTIHGLDVTWTAKLLGSDRMAEVEGSTVWLSEAATAADLDEALLTVFRNQHPALSARPIETVPAVALPLPAGITPIDLDALIDAPDCLPDCEYSAERPQENDGHLCRTSVGESPVVLGNGKAYVSVDRFQADDEGVHDALVAVSYAVGDRLPEEPQELTPAGARELAAQLLAAADLAEQTNKQHEARQTA